METSWNFEHQNFLGPSQSVKQHLVHQVKNKKHKKHKFRNQCFVCQDLCSCVNMEWSVCMCLWCEICWSNLHGWLSMYVSPTNIKTLSLHLRSMFPQTHQVGIPMILKQLKGPKKWTGSHPTMPEEPWWVHHKTSEFSKNRTGAPNPHVIGNFQNVLQIPCQKVCLNTPKPICRRDWSTRDKDLWYSPPSKKRVQAVGWSCWPKQTWTFCRNQISYNYIYALSKGEKCR